MHLSPSIFVFFFCSWFINSKSQFSIWSPSFSRAMHILEHMDEQRVVVFILRHLSEYIWRSSLRLQVPLHFSNSDTLNLWRSTGERGSLFAYCAIFQNTYRGGASSVSLVPLYFSNWGTLNLNLNVLESW